MAKFHGKIGYVRTEETAPGVYSQVATEIDCVGDILRNNQGWGNSGTLNDNITVNSQFTIIGNEFAYENLQKMRYLVWMGSKWKITSFEILRPRIILTIGGVYNG